MTACDDARFAASLELDRALDDVGRAGLRRHVDACPECARVVSGMRSASALLRRGGLVPHRCELGGGLARGCWSGPGRIWAGAGVAVAALVLTTGALPHRHEAPAPAPRVSVVPLALPIGQRSAIDDFTAPVAAASRTS